MGVIGLKEDEQGLEGLRAESEWKVTQERREKGMWRKEVYLPIEKNPSNWVIKRQINLIEHDSEPEGDALVAAMFGVLAGFLLFLLMVYLKVWGK